MKNLQFVLVLICLSFAAHAAGTNLLPLMDRDEPLFAETSREMRERGDYVIPYFNGEPFYHKPPLIYWCQATSYAVFGENEWAARFPSVLFALLTTLTVFGLGNKLYGLRIGFWSAVIFCLCPQTLVLAKAAVTDTALVFFMTLSVWSAWELLDAKGKAGPFAVRWGWFFYGSLALGFLAKGPVALLPILYLILYARTSKLPDLNRSFRFEIGIPLVIILVGLWAVPALLRTEGEYLKIGLGTHVVGRSFRAMEGHGGKSFLTYLAMLPFYFVTIFISFYPWSLFLPKMFIGWIKKVDIDLRKRFLLCGVIVVFAVFSVIHTKLPHYTFPVLPLLSVLCAAWIGQKKWANKVFAIFGGGMLVFALSVSFFVFPWAAAYIPTRALIEKSTSWLKPEMEFASLNYNEPSLVWYFRKYVRGWYYPLDQAGEVSKFMKKPGGRFAIVPSDKIDEIMPQSDLGWKTTSVKGFNVDKGKWVELTLLLKEN